MQFIRPDTKIDFVGFRYKAFAISGLMILLGIVFFFVRGGLTMGVDFAGGVLVQVKFAKPTTPDDIRKAIAEAGLERSAVQQVGATADHEYLIRTDLTDAKLDVLSKKIEDGLAKTYGAGGATIRRVEMVGPKVGADLRQKALLAIYYAILFMAIYIAGRFEFKWTKGAVLAAFLFLGIYLLEVVGLNVVYLIIGAVIVTLALCWFMGLPYAVGSSVALIHDVLIVMGAYAMLDKEFTLEVVAALLTLVGFSVNYNIIIFDRIRENQQKHRKLSLREIVNLSVNQTLSRTVLTSWTVFMTAILLFFLGGPVIHDFAFAVWVGVLTGTFSSIYVASPILILHEDWLNARKKAAKAAAAAAGKAK